MRAEGRPGGVTPSCATRPTLVLLSLRHDLARVGDHLRALDRLDVHARMGAGARRFRRWLVRRRRRHPAGSTHLLVAGRKEPLPGARRLTDPAGRSNARLAGTTGAGATGPRTSGQYGDFPRRRYHGA